MAASFHLPIFFALFAVTSLPAAEVVVPQGYTPERYERIWKKSPFTVASVIAPEATNNASFADNLSLVGLVTIGGKPLVTVVATDSQETSLVDADKPNAAGLQVASFVNNLDPSKVEVVLKKGDATGTLRFNINETAAPPPEQVNVVPQANQPRRIIQPRPNGMPVPTPSQARVLPRTGAPVMPGQPNGQIIRRRQLQLPGANPSQFNQPNRNNPQKGNAIPPP